MLIYFLRRSFLFFFIFLWLLFTLFHVISEYGGINGNLVSEEFLKKIESFEKFSSKENPINIVIGSSYVATINKEGLNSNWTTFSSAGMNVYESYKFLKYYVNKTKIDTILLGISPIDFSENISIGVRTGNSFYFGIDNNNVLDLKSRLQKVKDNIFKLKIPNKLELNLDTLNINPKFSISNIDSIEDSSYIDGMFIYYFVKWFKNVKELPNLDNFNLFYSLAKKNNITLICYFSPKTIYWTEGLKMYGLELTWKNIKDSLQEKDLIIFDLESHFKDNTPYKFFTNADHLSPMSVPIITNLIKQKLKQLSYPP